MELSEQKSEEKNPKTLIGVLSSHDSLKANTALASVFKDAFKDQVIKELLRNFRFVFTDGTFRRLFDGKVPVNANQCAKEKQVGDKTICYHLNQIDSKNVCTFEGGSGNPCYILEEEVKQFLINECGVIRLPSTHEGGVVMLSHLITQRKVSIIWPFLSPITTHLLFPVNLSLLRLADQWHVKKLMNKISVEEWLRFEARQDANLNKQEVSFKIYFKSSVENEDQKKIFLEYKNAVFASNNHSIEIHNKKENPLVFETRDVLTEKFGEMTVALISHDDMKNRMIDFVTDYEHELSQFKSILATGTTGKLIAEAAPDLNSKIKKYHSGPKGGDIEIATEIFWGACDLVIFFVDPLHSHPHIEDIRVVFGACMYKDTVRMLTNEAQARDWMNRVVRGTS